MKGCPERGSASRHDTWASICPDSWSILYGVSDGIRLVDWLDTWAPGANTTSNIELYLWNVENVGDYSVATAVNKPGITRTNTGPVPIRGTLRTTTSPVDPAKPLSPS